GGGGAAGGGAAEEHEASHNREGEARQYDARDVLRERRPAESRAAIDAEHHHRESRQRDARRIDVGPVPGARLVKGVGLIGLADEVQIAAQDRVGPCVVPDSVRPDGRAVVIGLKRTDKRCNNGSESKSPKTPDDSGVTVVVGGGGGESHEFHLATRRAQPGWPAFFNLGNRIHPSARPSDGCTTNGTTPPTP